MKEQQGFTLLELCICLVLFSIFLEGLWSVYSCFYFDYVKLNQQVSLMNEESNVEEFVRECMREAKQMKITVKDQMIQPNMKFDDSNNKDVVDKPLQKIEFTRMLQTSDDTYEEKKCKIEMVYIGGKNSNTGKYKLTYEAPGKPGANTISDQIEKITVTHYKNSDYVEFTCVMNRMGEQDERLICTEVFSESLAYKQQYK